MKVCPSFGWFGTLHQSNLVPRTVAEFDPSQHTFQGDVLLSPPGGILLIVCCTKTLQYVGKTPLLPILSVPVHPADPVAPCRQLLAFPPTKSTNQLLLLCIKKVQDHTVSHHACQRPQAHAMSPGVGHKAVLFDSLWRGGAMVVYRVGADQLDIKRHGMWSIEAFWVYITDPCVSTSLVSRAIACYSTLYVV